MARAKQGQEGRFMNAREGCGMLRSWWGVALLVLAAGCGGGDEREPVSEPANPTRVEAPGAERAFGLWVSTLTGWYPRVAEQSRRDPSPVDKRRDRTAAPARGVIR